MKAKKTSEHAKQWGIKCCKLGAGLSRYMGTWEHGKRGEGKDEQAAYMAAYMPQDADDSMFTSLTV
jgi:hypothetical protein